MPNVALQYEAKGPITLTASVVEDHLAERFLLGTANALHDVAGVSLDDVEMEIRPFGKRITLNGGTMFQVTLTIRALRRENWEGVYNLNGVEMLKPQAATQLACTNIILQLADTGYAYLGFDVKLENGPVGGYYDSNRALADILMKSQD